MEEIWGGMDEGGGKLSCRVSGNVAQRKIKMECMQREAEPDRERPRQEQQKAMRGWKTTLCEMGMY